ncbi:MAG: GerMN domain-containing protein [Clostridiales bacterium]|nr:GerMN domain-containing protein [Clostridiales bacterium]
MKRRISRALLHRQTMVCLAFLCCLLPLLAVAEQAPAIPPDEMLSPYTRRSETVLVPYTLYFGYRNTLLLGREMREVSVPRAASAELSVVQALLDGPGSLSPHLVPLFPPGTQVLSVVPEGDRLFVTFSEALMGRYADEALIDSPDYRAGLGQQRRRLAMAGLVNTLTESGRYSSVQVLVRGETYVSTSMRLSNRYYLLNNDLLPDPLVRQDELILTPQAAVSQFLDAWQRQEWSRATQLIGGSLQADSILPSEYELTQRLQNASQLLEWTVTPGTIALDGQSAVVSVSYSARQKNGVRFDISAKPVKLLLVDGVYLIPFQSALRLTGLTNE